MSFDFKTVKYVADDGAEYRMRARADRLSTTNQTATGAEGAEAADLAFKRQFKPRHVTVGNATAGYRSVICYTAAAPLFSGSTTSISLPDETGEPVVFTRIESHGEVRRGTSLDSVLPV